MSETRFGQKQIGTVRLIQTRRHLEDRFERDWKNDGVWVTCYSYGKKMVIYTMIQKVSQLGRSTLGRTLSYRMCGLLQIKANVDYCPDCYNYFIQKLQAV